MTLTTTSTTPVRLPTILSGVEHGSWTAYGRGCRCDECVEMRRDSVREGMRRHRSNNMLRTDEQINKRYEEMHPLGTKTCQVCRRDLPKTAYHANRYNSDGMQSHCYGCEVNRKAMKRKLKKSDFVAADGELYCVYCGDPANCIDHFFALVNGGSDRMSNIVPACMACNTKKGVRDPFEFMASEGFTHVIPRAFDYAA